MMSILLRPIVRAANEFPGFLRCVFGKMRSDHEIRLFAVDTADETKPRCLRHTQPLRYGREPQPETPPWQATIGRKAGEIFSVVPHLLFRYFETVNVPCGEAHTGWVPGILCADVEGNGRVELGFGHGSGKVGIRKRIFPVSCFYRFSILTEGAKTVVVAGVK